MFNCTSIGCGHFAETRHQINVHFSTAHKFLNNNGNILFNGSRSRKVHLATRNVHEEGKQPSIDQIIKAAFDASTAPIAFRDILPYDLKLL